MKRLFAIFGLMVLSVSAHAETDPAEAARIAAQKLAEAAQSMKEAQSANDRVKALTETVKGYEAGLAAMRTGLRRVAIRETQLTNELASRDAETSRLLGALLSIGSNTGPTVLLHPEGPLGTARSGMLLADVTPALSQEADVLRKTLSEVSLLRKLQQDATLQLQSGLKGVQEARTALSQAIADRKDLPRRFTEDPVQTAVLLAATETLGAFADNLPKIAANEAPGDLPDISERRGELALPVKGIILRKADEPDAAGIARPGIVLATRAKALVSTPAAATIRYLGPLLDYGQVVILEPQKDTLFVFAGLDTVYGEIGLVIPAGSPIGLMGGEDQKSESNGEEMSETSGNDRSETLYIEVRENNAPVDPLEWFDPKRD